MRADASVNFDRNKKLSPVLLERARAMRHDPASAEQKLWSFLRDRQIEGFKFRRQHVIKPYIADFYCHELKLVIELDGDSHGDREEYDARRTKYFERDGLRVIRFLNDDVMDHLDAVLDHLYSACQSSSLRRPSS